MLTGWGRSRRVLGQVVESEDLAAATRSANLTRGLGRSYGDSALPAVETDVLACSVRADRLLAFDPESGVVRVEAGLSLRELNRLFLSRGWFVPVSPGTQFVTVGGMVAADVHGKNHHRAGCFGEHVRCLLLRVADGRTIECSDLNEKDLFRATLGGMGLTGHILEVEFLMERIPTPWIWTVTRRVSSLDAMIEGLRGAAETWPFTVGWLDCLAGGPNLGRGHLITGRWAEPSEAPLAPPPFRPVRRVGVELPEWILSPGSMKLFNAAYYHRPVATRGRVVSPLSFFYPLDVIGGWNRMYGRRGFTQYQCVLPHREGNEAARRFLTILASHRAASFLAVIKDFGAEGKGLLSFPRPGITISLDIPVREGTEVLVADLNEVVANEGGRIYLAKDAFTQPAVFRRMEGRLTDFLAIRSRWDPEARLRSAQSVRLLGDVA